MNIPVAFQMKIMPKDEKDGSSLEATLNIGFAYREQILPRMGESREKEMLSEQQEKTTYLVVWNSKTFIPLIAIPSGSMPSLKNNINPNWALDANFFRTLDADSFWKKLVSNYEEYMAPDKVIQSPFRYNGENLEYVAYSVDKCVEMNLSPSLIFLDSPVESEVGVYANPGKGKRPLNRLEVEEEEIVTAGKKRFLHLKGAYIPLNMPPDASSQEVKELRSLMLDLTEILTKQNLSHDSDGYAISITLNTLGESVQRITAWIQSVSNMQHSVLPQGTTYNHSQINYYPRSNASTDLDLIKKRLTQS